MRDFNVFSPEDVIYANLRETALRTDMICEQEIAHLRELAAEITKGIDDNPALANSISDLLTRDFEHVSDALPENAEILRRTHPFHTTWQRILLCMEIRKRLSANRPLPLESLFPDPDEVSSNALERIAYQRSSYADTAYLQFAKLLNLPRAVYTHSFPAACEEVYNGLCEYCLLPLENSSEGPLNSFTRLIDRYRLKIAATCDVTATDGSRTTKFVLLRRNIMPLLKKDPQDLYFELSIPTESPFSVISVLNAAELCGLTLHRIDSRPTQSEHSHLFFTHATFSVSGGDLTAFLLYILIHASAEECIGIYPHLN